MLKMHITIAYSKHFQLLRKNVSVFIQKRRKRTKTMLCGLYISFKARFRPLHLKLRAKIADVWMLYTFNNDTKNINAFLRTQKRTEVDENLYFVFLPLAIRLDVPNAVPDVTLFLEDHSANRR